MKALVPSSFSSFPSVKSIQGSLLSYMKLLDIPIGLLINFHELKLVNGIHRLILPGANEP